MAAAVEHFGGIDIVVNNASVLDISKTEDLAMKRFDLMQAGQRPWHLRAHPRVPSVPSGFGQCARVDAVAAAQLFAALVGCSSGLHVGQIRNDIGGLGHRRRVFRCTDFE